MGIPLFTRKVTDDNRDHRVGFLAATTFFVYEQVYLAETPLREEHERKSKRRRPNMKRIRAKLRSPPLPCPRPCRSQTSNLTRFPLDKLYCTHAPYRLSKVSNGLPKVHSPRRNRSRSPNHCRRARFCAGRWSRDCERLGRPDHPAERVLRARRGGDPAPGLWRDRADEIFALRHTRRLHRLGSLH
jgi:hypothetical protein